VLFADAVDLVRELVSTTDGRERLAGASRSVGSITPCIVALRSRDL